MNNRQALSGLFATAALTATMAGASNAATTTSVASFSDLLSGQGTTGTLQNNTLYTTTPPGTGQTLFTTVSDGIGANPNHQSLFSFTPVVNSGGAGVNGDGSRFEYFTGGTFKFTNGNASTTYLTGTVGNVILTGTSGVGTMQLKSNGNVVTYTGGTFLTELGLSPGAIGSFSWSYSGTQSGAATGPTFTSGHFDNLSAKGISGTFDTSQPFLIPGSTPEPGTMTALAFGAMGLMGMMFAARRRKSMNVA